MADEDLKDIVSIISKLTEEMVNVAAALETAAQKLSNSGNNNNPPPPPPPSPSPSPSPSPPPSVINFSTELNKLNKELAIVSSTTRGLDNALSKYKNNIIGATGGLANAALEIFNIGRTAAAYDSIVKLQQQKLEKANVSGTDDEKRQAQLNLDKAKADAAIKPFLEASNRAAQALDNFTRIVREGQQRLGLDAGQALQLEFKNAFASIGSYAQTIMSGGATAGVSVQEIRGAQQSMQAQFGGVISSKDAAELARQAKEMGVTTQQLAQARRTFMTTTMGDMGRAAAEQDRFITVFQQKGLTSKDAMEAIGKNGELLARAGTRFADSFARAAVESKKIGVELSKVNQVGDNIIGNFEGFLESQAELGAMGFGFDTSRLAEIAESGDTGALMDELRSQLAMTGKDLGSLRRSEQLALSSAFGMDIGELQRMSGPTPEVAEQQKGNKFLERMVNLFEGLGGTFGLISSVLQGTHTLLLSGILKNTTISAAASGGGLLDLLPGKGKITRMRRQTRVAVGRAGQRAGGLISRVPGISKAGSMAMAPTRLAMSGATKAATRLGTGGLLAGAAGGVSGFIQARKEGKDVATASGAAAVRGTGAGVGAAAGAALGTALLPGIGTAIGTVVGGFAGDTIGKALNKFAPGLSANVGALFKGIFAPIKAVFEPIKPAIDGLKESFSGIFELFSGEGNTISEFAKKALPVMETIGKVIGTLLTPAFIILSLAIQSIIGIITLVVDITKGIVAWLSGESFKDAFDSLGKNLINALLGGIRTIPGGDWLINKITGLGSSEGRAERRASADARREERQANSWSAQRAASRTAEVSPTQTAADDMVSRPGYGQRTLVTPTTAVALNDEDNVVAYADDMISQNTGLELLSKGAISREMDTTSKVSVDLTALEKKLDQMIVAIQNMRDVSMDVKMDADLVGRAIVRSSERSMQSAVFRPMDV